MNRVNELQGGPLRVYVRFWMLNEDGQHQSRQFVSYAGAQTFDAQTKAHGPRTGGATGQQPPIAKRNAVLVTLANLWEEWFPLYSATIAPATADGYELCWTAHIEPALGSRPLSDFLTSFPVEEMHAQLAKRKVGSSGSVRFFV